MTDLSGIMANLELRDQFADTASGSAIINISQNEECTTSLRRNPRRCSGTNFVEALSNKRRCNLKPIRNLNGAKSKCLENYYRNDKYKPPLKTNLETIYEEPLVKSGSVVLLGANKQRRIIFSGRITKDKLKKRKTKIKKVATGEPVSSRLKKKGQRLTMEEFLTKLQMMMSDARSDTMDGPNEESALLEMDSSNHSSI